MHNHARRLVALALVVGGLLVAVGPMAPPADARTMVSVGIGVPAYGGYYGPPPYYPYGPPAYYYPPPAPVYVAPPPTYVLPVPAPAPVVQGPAPAATWYYCEDPKGYYPYVPNCNGPWRAVQPTPAQ